MAPGDPQRASLIQQLVSSLKGSGDAGSGNLGTGILGTSAGSGNLGTTSTGTTSTGTTGTGGGILSSLQGLGGSSAKLGPPTMGNMLAPIALGGALGAGNATGGGSLAGALTGMGTAGLLSFLLRRRSQQQQKAGMQPGSGEAGFEGGSAIGALGQPGLGETGTAGSGEVAGLPPNNEFNDFPEMAEAGEGAGPLLNNEFGDFSEMAQGGDVHADAEQDRRQTLGILKEKNLIKKKARGGKSFAAGAAENLPEPPLRKPKAVLVRKPAALGAHPVPVISTTIVLSKKKPGSKKKKGGAMKAEALPPKRGPANGNGTWPPSPYRKGGHVQVPRGSGAAIRGKRFGGIF
jgi:hypothetical protein